MGFTNSINAEWGVIKFLGTKGLDFKGRRGKLNHLITEYLIEYNLPVVKHNPRYKGTYDALNKNCATAQSNWNTFHQWVDKKIQES
jgi:hypothetical protein